MTRRYLKFSMVCPIFILVAQVSLTDAANSNLFIPYITIPINASFQALAIGDVNSDGRNDVVTTTSYLGDPDNDFKLFVFLQNTLGLLDPPVKYDTSGIYTNGPATVAIGDVNNDGRADVVVGNAGLNIEVFLQNDLGGFESSQKYPTVDSDQIRIGDFNGDGLLDVVGVSEATQTASVFLQNIGGTFDSPEIYSVTHAGPVDLDIGDINGDGLTDIIVMGGWLYAYPNFGVLTQTADGTFNSAVYYDLGDNTISQGVAVGDVDGDAAEDVVVSYGSGGMIGVFLQNPGGTLNSPVSYSAYCCTGYFDNPVPVEIADVNKDGRQDILVAHPGWLGVYLQDAGGTLAPEALYPLPSTAHYFFNPQGLAVGDINGDGTKDVVITINNPYTDGSIHELAVLYNQEGLTIPDISVSPSSIDFGSLFVGDISLEAVSITNTGTGNLLVNTITLTGEDGEQYGIQNDDCSGTSLGPAGSCTLDVIFSPSSTGAKTAALRIPSNDLPLFAVYVPLSGMAAVHAQDYLPLDPGTVWKYLKNGKQAALIKVLNKKVNVRGVWTSPVKFVEENLTEYVTSDSDGIFLHRQYQPHIYIGGVGWVDIDVTLIPPIKLAEGEVWIGQSFHSSGTARTLVLPQGWRFDFDYTADSTIEAEETITVPAGTFDAIRTRESITLYDQTISETRYLAKGIGIVKDVAINPQGKTATFELVSMTSLALRAPNAGEVIPSGGAYDIIWKSSPDMTTFQLEYSLDNGVTWVPIRGAEKVTENHYLWTVPMPAGNRKACLIKVTGYNTDKIKVKADISDAPFTIEVVDVISPRANDILVSAETAEIKWTKHATKRTVTKIKLSYTLNDGVTWIPIPADITEDADTYLWTVPDVTTLKSKCKVKVVLQDDKGISLGSDTTDGFFSITPQRLLF